MDKNQIYFKLCEVDRDLAIVHSNLLACLYGLGTINLDSAGADYLECVQELDIQIHHFRTHVRSLVKDYPDVISDGFDVEKFDAVDELGLKK